MRLALGTAQFGLPYGVANRFGQVELAEIARILELARGAGMDTLDTAIAYGTSEARLGEVGVAGWRVVSKLPEIPSECTDVRAYVNDAIEGSLRRLKVNRLHALLLHRPLQLLGPHGDALFDALVSLRAQNLVGAIGASIYSPAELDSLWPRFRFDAVQLPYSVVDRRIETSGWLTTLKTAAVEIHVRSVFLQGLLLMAPQDRPSFTARWPDVWRAWDAWVAEQSITRLGACLGFAIACSEVDRVIVGVDRVAHLREILESVGRSVAITPVGMASDDEELVNPGRWPVL